MSRPRGMLVGLVIGMAMIAVARTGHAQDMQPVAIGYSPCAAKVHLVARNATLKDVLERLSASLAFTLQFDGASDAIVNIDASLPAATLIAKLSASDSIIVSQSRDPRCPEQNRIDKVWVLAKGSPAKTGPATAVASPGVSARNVDELARQAKEAYQAYVQAHGKPPPGAEEEISKPQ